MSVKNIVPVILCGGSGTRLWPLSRQTYPKQLLSLVGEHSLLQATALRIAAMQQVAAPIVICNESYRFIVAEQLREVGIDDACIILEPVGKNTAPAIAMAALQLQQNHSNAMMLVLPADHVLKQTEKFQQAVMSAAELADAGFLVTFGISPTRPETGYGYIKKGQPFPDLDGYQVEKFVEKPPIETAQEYVTSGDYFWNSGMFMLHSQQYLSELEKNAPDILQACRNTFINMKTDLDFLRIDAQSFAACRSDSIDYAVMEKAHKVAVVTLNAEWSDIGSWQAMWEIKTADSDGNVMTGDVHADQVKNCYLHAESRLLAVVGVSDHIVIETDDAVLVAHKDYCQDIKTIVNTLKKQERQEVESHRRVYRPWGYYEILKNTENFQVKRLAVKPGAKLSLQSHRHRSEHWIVIKGIADVTRHDEQFLLQANQSTYIPCGVKHRLANPGEELLVIIEVQSGEYLGEDDIERFEDVYGRELLSE